MDDRSRGWVMEQLDALGESASNEFTDGEVQGWFGFSISDSFPPVMSVRFVGQDDEDTVEYSWELREVNG